MLLIFALLLVLLQGGAVAHADREFYIDWDNDRFVKDGETFQYASAGMHYFRIPHQYWNHRIMAAKSAGLNAIQTYVAWNGHEPSPGVYNFEGDFDIMGFIQLVQAAELPLILRVGPYICAEWNFGGLPPWLLAHEGEGTQVPVVRTMDDMFLSAVASWLAVLLPMVEPYLYKNGGPIIMVQVENEYGSYGCDHDYVNNIYNMFSTILGNEAVYFTTDGPGLVKCGSRPQLDTLTTIDFGIGYNASKTFQKLRAYQAHGPLVNSEFYTGWLDHWGHKHATTGDNLKALDKSLDGLLAIGASVNLYMWHGGTNWGLTSGNQFGGQFNPTSYDYNAPQAESGDVDLGKYWTIRNVTAKHFGPNKLPPPADLPKLGYQPISTTLVGKLVDEMMHLKDSDNPLTFERLGVFEGIVGYEWKGSVKGKISIVGVHDRAYVLADGVYIKVLHRKKGGSTVEVNVTDTLLILVENMGYIGYSKAMGNYTDQYKGILSVTLDKRPLTGWSHWQANLRNPDTTTTSTTTTTTATANTGVSPTGRPLLEGGPSIYTATLTLDSVADTFLNVTECWSKGFVIVNGRMLGRYWPDAGPQFTLFLPGVWLKEGENSVTLIELQSYTPSDTSDCLYITDKPTLDGPFNPGA